MDYVVIDVREPEEYAAGHVEGALNITAGQLMNGASELSGMPKDANLIIYCRTGSRSAVAKNILQQLGFNNAINGINKERVEIQYGL